MKIFLEAGLALSLFLSPIQLEIIPEAAPAETPEPPDIVAHRGASGYAPENTMAAFDKAVEMEADVIELDVHRSRDGKMAVIHDATVNRTTNGTGKVEELTLEELKNLDAGSWMGEEFAGEQIPTLEEVLDRYYGKIKLLIELKNPERYPGIEEELAELLKARQLDRPQNEEIMVQSFDFESMKKVNELLPDVPVGVLTSSSQHVTRQALAEFSTYADYFNPHYSLVTEKLVQDVHQQGMKIGAWTVRNRETADFLLNMGVDAIITDYPDYVNIERVEGNNSGEELKNAGELIEVSGSEGENDGNLIH